MSARLALLVLIAHTLTGCQVPCVHGRACHVREQPPVGSGMSGEPVDPGVSGVRLANWAPRELAKASLPPYVIETPDILLIEVANPLPKPPHRVKPGDQLRVIVDRIPEEHPVAGDYLVQPSGEIELGPFFGTIQVAGLALPDEVRDAVADAIRSRLPAVDPFVQAGLSATAPVPGISGQHLVRPDGTVGLGYWGSVYVAGLTIDEAQREVAEHLGQHFVDPQVMLDVLAYNSKFFYLVSNNGGAGETVVRLPLTGNETVLDAVSAVGGLSAVSYPKHIWLARPTPVGETHIMPIHWPRIAKHGDPTTNYQLMAGDRIYISSDPLVRLDTALAKILSPIERVMGAVLLTTSTVQRLEGRSSGLMITP